jgi:hypothetical protein
MGGDKGIQNVVRKLEEKQPLRRPMHRWKNNVKVILNVVRSSELDSSG